MSVQNCLLHEPLSNGRLRDIQQYLVNLGVNQCSARDVAANDLEHWPLDQVKSIFAKLTKMSGNLRSLETTWLHAMSDNIAEFTTSDIYWTRVPPDLLESSAKEGRALCINRQGEFRLLASGYFCISHVWIEGIRSDEKQNRGIAKHRIRQIFERIALVNAEWIWLDGLAIPSGSRSLTFKEEEQKTAIINSLAKIYENCKAVLVFDALTMHLESDNPVETAIVLRCGKWMTRVWTWQELKLTRKALVITASSMVDSAEIFEVLRLHAHVGPGPEFHQTAIGSAADQKYYVLFMSIARLTRNDQVGISLPDIAFAVKERTTGNDIDYARALFPALGLTWRTGLSREDAMQTIYEARIKDSTRLVLQHGSPRNTSFPGWAPSYLTGLEGVVLSPIPYESRGLRRKWWTTKIARTLPTQKVRGLLLSLTSFNMSLEPPLCGCELGKGESQATMNAMAKAIKAGNAYLLSDMRLHPVDAWAKHALLVEKVPGSHNESEAYVLLTVAVTVIQDNATTSETEWLIRHENPVSEHELSGKVISQLRIDLGHDQTHGKHRLITAAHNGDIKTVQSLMQTASDVNDRDEKGWTALHAASVSNQLEVVRILLRPPLRFNINAVDITFRTPLYLAARTGADDIIDLLIDSGADPNHSHPKGYMSILDQATKYELSSTLQLLLLKGADPNKPNPKGLPPLVFAHERPEMVRILLDHRADLLSMASEGVTALHFAARSGSIKTIQLMLDRGVDPDLRERNSLVNPLFTATEQQHEDVVALLLRRGASPDTVYADGWTALMVACKTGNLKNCQALVEAGARTDEAEKCRPQGWTALHIAAMAGHRVIVKLLIEKRAPLDARDACGATPLKLATDNGNTSVVIALRTAGAKAL